MGRLDFHIDFNLNVPDLPESLEIESSERIQALNKDRQDLIGALISLDEIAGVKDPFLYEARIVAYKKPENIAVSAKENSPEAALKQALSALERTVREDRNQRRSYE